MHELDSCSGRRIACDLTVACLLAKNFGAVADCGLLLATAPHAARTEVISLTILDGPLSEFQPERLCQLSFPRFNASTVQLFTSPKVEYQMFRTRPHFPILSARNNRHRSCWLNFRCLANAMSLTS